MNMKRLVIFLLVALIPLMAVPQDPISRPGKKKQNTTQTTSGKKKQNTTRTTSGKKKTTSVKKQSVKRSEPDGFVNDHGYVDLGLSVKWATCNVGASSPSDYGDYYAWGETSTTSSYDVDNSKTYRKSMGNIGGNSSYDVARYRWGGSWRLPTKAELEELKTECTWTWTTQGGHNGYKVTGKNGKSIFLPAAGYRYDTTLKAVGEIGSCWSSTPYESNTISAYYLFFNPYRDYYVDWLYRYFGRSVRPVVE